MSGVSHRPAVWNWSPIDATLPYDPDNIFAKILRGELPCHKVYEDSDAIAFMDVMPQGTGHTLVVPANAVSQPTVFSVREGRKSELRRRSRE